MRQVLINLLSNAVKFTPRGGRIVLEARCQFTRTPAGSEAIDLQLFVRDTGIGIAAEDADKLFQPFVQVDSALNRQYAGTGLGLALVKRLVELHGGRISLESELGAGSCFTIDLCCPVVAAPTGNGAQLQNSNGNLFDLAIHEEHSCRAPLLLLAEDNAANVLTISSYLRARGYDIIVANDGREAIDLARAEQQPDLILMDIQMPGMDGFEAMANLRDNDRTREIPIVALTALAMEGDCDRCLAAGARAYLAKPVVLKQLAATIRQYLPASVMS